MASPKDLREFCAMGIPCPPNPNDWLYKVWGKAWVEGDIGITSRPVVRDESPISLDPPLPSSCWVMEKFEQHEFTPFWVSDVYVRDSFVPLARLIIAFYGGDHASSTATGIFTNPFVGFKAAWRKVVIVSGSSDNGKTVFLYFLLRCRLQAKLPTILQLCHEKFILFSEFGVHEFPELPFASERASVLATIAPDLWCLVDSNNANYTPSDFLRSSRLSIIQTASLRQPRIHWSQKSNIDVQFYFMPPFTLEEAIIVRSLWLKPAPSESQLHYWFNTYTPSAQLAFLNACNPGRYERERLQMLLSRISDLTSLHALTSRVMSLMDDDLSHEVFVLFPSGDYDSYTCCIPTRHLANKLIEHCGLQDEKQCRHCFYTLLSRLQLTAPAGFLVEEE